MREHNIPGGPVRTFLDLAADPDALANGYILDGFDPVWGRRLSVGHPFQLSESPAAPSTRMPLLGQHTNAELSRAGFSFDEIDALAASGAVQPSPGQADSTGTEN